MAAPFDNSFAKTLQPVSPALFSTGANSGGSDRLAEA
jgi:hypothetical protein